jgi:phosphoribosyl-AMP cyclohydrolase / phosphoribosyl-ATP pyrophosphohydrolase
VNENFAAFDLNALDFSMGNGLVIVVVQDANTGDVLMVAHADVEALTQTIETGEMHFRSRTRGLWHKGATSGSVQRVVSLSADCDRDTVLARVMSAGPACHTGARSCFDDAHFDALRDLDRTIAQRAASAEGGEPSYTRRLLADRNLRLKKIGEESAELVTALADGARERAVEEAADLMYHVLVGLHAVGASLADVRETLAARARPKP